MPNQNHFSNDGSFYETFLNEDSLQETQLSEEHLNSRIKHEIYNMEEGSSPHYYEGNRVASEFNAFAKTEIGKETIQKIQTELQVCFQKLSTWSKTNKLEVTSYTIDEQTGEEISITNGVDSELKNFYDRLIQGDFSEKVIMFYTDGKKLIEILTVLIQDSTIDLTSRQNELINLTADGNLKLCADGCFSRFSTAVELLKNYGDLALLTLKKKFIRSLCEEIAKEPLFKGVIINYSQAICDAVGINPEGNEIHAQNFLINTWLEKVNLKTLTIQDDFVEHLIIPSNSPSKDYFYQLFEREVKNAFTPTRFIQFIKNEFYRANHIDNAEESALPEGMDISENLKILGNDPEFGAAEVLSWDEEQGIIILQKEKLSITLTERLYDQDVFDPQNACWIKKYTFLSSEPSDFNFMPVVPNTFAENYRIIPGNIELSWLKFKNGDRVLLLQCLEHIAHCLEILKENIPEQSVKSLFINVGDLEKFFTKLPKERQMDALSWMQQKEVVFTGVLLNENYYDVRMYPFLGLQYKLLYLKHYNNLFSKLTPEALAIFIEQLDAAIIKKFLSENIALINQEKFTEFDLEISTVIDFLQYLIKGNFKDFPSMTITESFEKSHDGKMETYWKDIDFSERHFADILSYVSFERLNFEGCTFENFVINNHVIGVNFKKAEGKNIQILGNIIHSDFSDSSSNISVMGKVENSILASVTGEILIDGNIELSTISESKGKFTVNGNVSQTDLNNFEGIIEINGKMDTVNVKNSRGESLEINGEVQNCLIHNIQFENIHVIGEMSNSYWTSMDFRKINFVDPQSEISSDIANSDFFKVTFKFNLQENEMTPSFFQDSQFSTDSLIQFIQLPSIIEDFAYESQYFPLLRATDLSEVDFQSAELQTALKKFKLLDFSGANLQARNFDHFLQNETPYLYQLNLKGANLSGSSFAQANLANAIFDEANLSDCDLATAVTDNIGVRSAKIDNIRLNCEQLVHFYTQGHRDFSTLRLVGDLEHVEVLSLVGTKLSSQAFEHLIKQGFKNFNEIDLTAVSRELIDKYRNQKDLFFEKALLPTEKLALSLTDCLEGGSRRKREIRCLFDVEDVKEFSSDGEPDERQIDSERFLKVLQSAEEEKQAQLIDFASLYPVVGTKQAEVQKIKEFRQWQLHLNKVGQVAGLVTQGLMLKSSLASFLNGNYTDTAINLGFLGGGPFLAQFSQELESMGEAFLFEGKNLLGNGFKAASPFFKRGTAAFMVYDLIQAIKELNSNDSAWVRVMGDSIYIGVDIVEIGIETAEVFEIFEGVSVITGPIGGVIGVVVFLGTDVYQAVQRVKQLDSMLHLTEGEKFREGVRAFLGMGIEGYLQELLQEKQFNEALIKQKWEFLKQHSTIKNIFFPTQQQVCHKESYLEGEKWAGGEPRRRLVEVCDQSVEDADNQIRLDKPKEQITFSRAKPEVPEVGDLLCFPSGNEGSSGLSYRCQNLIGISDPNQKIGNDTLINLGEGEGRAYGFLESPNIIFANDGNKHLIGGNKNDTFILHGEVISGFIDGGEGVNTLDLGSFATQGSLQINLNGLEHYITNNNYGFKNLKTLNIQQVFGRENQPDHMYLGCNITSANGRGGNFDSYGRDVIVIGDRQECPYHMQLSVSPYTLIINQANQGDFSYLLSQGNGSVEIRFEPQGKDIAQHQISFNYTWLETKKIQFLPDNTVMFHLVSASGNELNVTLIRSNSTMISGIFMDQTEIKLGQEKTYTLRQTNEMLTAMVQQYPILAEKLHGTIVTHFNNQTLVVGYPFHHDVLQNDPLHPSYLMGNGGENIYKIIPNTNNQKIPKITLYPPQSNSNQVETLDLREVVQEIERHKHCRAQFQVKKKGKNLNLFVTTNRKCKWGQRNNHRVVLRVILKDAVNIPWVHRLNILTHQSFLKISSVKINKGGHSHTAWILLPKPLIFNKNKKIIILSARDVEPQTRVRFPKMPGGFTFARSGEDLQDLVITSNQIGQARTVLIQGFYSAQGRDAYKLQTLSLQFGNKTVNLKDVASRSVARLTTLQNNKKRRVYNAIFGKTASNVTPLYGANNGMLLGFALVPVVVVVYFVRRHVLGRRVRAGTAEGVTVALLAATSQQAEAKPIIPNTGMLACYIPPFKEAECTKSQFQRGELGYCTNGETKLAWFKEGETGALSYIISDPVDHPTFFERLFFRENDLYFLHSDQCQQRIPLKAMPLSTLTQDSFVQQLLTLVEEQKQIKQYYKEVAVQQFKQEANVIVCSYLGEQGLVHSHLGDYFRVVGLTPNWRHRDASHWINRILRSWSTYNVLSVGSMSGVCLETALLHPFVQSTLPGDTYRGKSVLRFIADLLQFGASFSICIPALVDFLYYQHPRSYEFAMGLRVLLTMLEVFRDPSSWYLGVCLFVLPQIPYLLENLGIPVTRYISHALEFLERFLLPYSLLLSVQEDSERLKIKTNDLASADQRVSKGQERILTVYHSGVGFFSKAKASENKSNDTKFYKPTQSATKS